MYENQQKILISVIMGSNSDWTVMQHAHQILTLFDLEHECRIISAHRTPRRLYSFAQDAEKNGIKIIIAGAGGAAHLPGMVASLTIVPVLAVPVESKALAGLDSLYSIVQMPKGIPVGCFAIGAGGAANAALQAVAILSLNDTQLATKLKQYRKKQADSVQIKPENIFEKKN